MAGTFAVALEFSVPTDAACWPLTEEPADDPVKGPVLHEREVIRVVALLVEAADKADAHGDVVIGWAMSAHGEHVTDVVDEALPVDDQVVANFEEAHAASLPAENVNRLCDFGPGVAVVNY